MMGINSKAYDNAFFKFNTAQDLDAGTVKEQICTGIVSVHPMYWIRRIIAGWDGECNVLDRSVTDVSIGTVRDGVFVQFIAVLTPFPPPHCG